MRAVSDGLKRTFDVLANTSNDAANDVLLPALESSCLPLRDAALAAALARGEPKAMAAIVRLWNTLEEPARAIVAQRSGRLHDALRDAVQSPSPHLCGNACDAILWTKEFELLPALVAAAEEPRNPRGDETARTLLALAEMLYEELAAPRDYRERRDPQCVRQHVTASLETAAARYPQHRRSEILDAFLLLANRENATLKRILHNPHDKCHLPLVEILATSCRPGVMRLLLAYLDDPHAPIAALSTLARRCDEVFIRHLLHRMGADSNPAFKANLKRLESIPWLRLDPRRLLALSETEQQAVVQLAVASGLKRPAVFEMLAFILRRGNVGGRRAAAAALAEFEGSEANALAMQTLDDSDPQVQIHILHQLRERGVPGAVTRLLALLDSPHEAVRATVQQCLAEFSFKRYLAAFDLLSVDVRRSTGALVRKIDPDALRMLSEELASASRTRKLRGLEVAGAMGVAAAVESHAIELLKDDEHLVRQGAVQLLASIDSNRARAALRMALLDRTPSVQAAAEQALAKWTHDFAVEQRVKA